MARFQVESLKSEDEQGVREWTLAARRGPKMDNGAAEFLDVAEADQLVEIFEREGSVARRIDHDSIATNGKTGDAKISVYELASGSLVAETNGDPIWEESEQWQELPAELREQAEKNRSH